MGLLLKDDYIDPDVAYLLGLIVARGVLTESNGVYQLVIEFPYQNLEVQGIDDKTYNVPDSIHIGLDKIRNRILELMGGDIVIHDTKESYQLIVRLNKKTIAWRTIILHLENKTSFRKMSLPKVLFDENVTEDIRMEFVRGFADVAGNVRPANRYVDGRNRVRLDVLNDNWDLPVRLCNFLQLQLGVPVQLITWGHPSLGRGFREHQINIFVTPFERIGFTFSHKQKVLESLIMQDSEYDQVYKACPGRRPLRKKKKKDKQEISEHLPIEVRAHFDAYWQICKAIGCPIEPSLGPLFKGSEKELVEED